MWLFLVLAGCLAATHAWPGEFTNEIPTEAEPSCEDEIKTLKHSVAALSRQLLLQQLFVEEKIRGDGKSGIKQVRTVKDGGRTYMGDSFTGGSVVSAHDHANLRNTVGLGEFAAVLNGVEFRTRHNDYKLAKPAEPLSKPKATEELPFPDVPKAVLEKETVEEQVKEMREWFKAFQNQDYSVRDYRDHFKPALCYLEGAWTNSGADIDESFDSDRHWLEAATWQEMQEKIRFTSYSGKKNNAENFAYLPTTIMKMVNETVPILAQWNYRILCHPLKEDIPHSQFQVIVDLQSMMASRRDHEAHKMSKAARFALDPKNRHWVNMPSRAYYGYLDTLMEQIPGRDGYGCYLTDNSFDSEAKHFNLSGGEFMDLNACYYHRWFRDQGNDAMGVKHRRRGYSDESIFMAMTTQAQIAGMKVKDCVKNKPNDCKEYSQKWTYVIPLEIIYMTPLLNWNPYNLEYHGKSDGIVTKGGRNGGLTPEKAYNGTSHRNYWRTPATFYNGDGFEKDPADTSNGVKGVLDPEGVVREVSASGVRIITPAIDGVGNVRMRYPIMPVHEEGSSLRKELDALKDIVLELQLHSHMLRDSPFTKRLSKVPAVTLRLNPGSKTEHEHQVILDEQDLETLQRNGYVWVYTETTEGHVHQLKVEPMPANPKKYIFTRCDRTIQCSGHNHKKTLVIVT